jgi:uncharacterized protein YecT (DUF1311 family)
MYTIRQVQAVFEAAGRMAKYMTSGIHGEGAWVAKIVGWFCGVVFGFAFRLEAAAFMIPIQAIVGLCQPNKENSEIVSRSVVVGVFAVAAGIGIYAVQQASGPQPVIPRQTSAMVVPSQRGIQVQRKTKMKKSVATPSFDCAKASTLVELLICRDGHLASLEAGMATAYNQALNRLPDGGRKALKQEHLAWFRNYSRTCNRAANDNDRATCVANFLSARTTELNNQR